MNVNLTPYLLTMDAIFATFAGLIGFYAIGIVREIFRGPRT